MELTLKGKKVVMFDMDGVLYDSMPNHAKAWNEAMEHYDMTMTKRDVYLNEGVTGKETISRISMRDRGRPAEPDEIREIYDHKARLFKNLPEVQVMPGALEVFSKVSAMGLDILIVTGSAQKNLIERAQRDFEGYITRESMITAFDVKRGKPHPDPYLKGLEIAGAEAAQAVVVENAPMGIRSAVAAGIDTIAVNTGPLEDSLLTVEGSKMLLHSMAALADWLDGQSV